MNTTNALGQPLDVMEDGMLFRVEWDVARSAYRATVSAPAGDRPFAQHTYITREEATKHRDANWVRGLSIDTAALELAKDKLKNQFTADLDEVAGKIAVQVAYESIDGFGSF